MHASGVRRRPCIFDAKCSTAAVPKRPWYRLSLAPHYPKAICITLFARACRAAPAQRLLQTTEQSHSDRSDECRDGWLQNSSRPLVLRSQAQGVGIRPCAPSSPRADLTGGLRKRTSAVSRWGSFADKAPWGSST